MLQMFEDKSRILPNFLLDEQSQAPRDSKVGGRGPASFINPKLVFHTSKPAVSFSLRLSCTHRKKLQNRTASLLNLPRRTLLNAKQRQTLGWTANQAAGRTLDVRYIQEKRKKGPTG